MTLLGTLELVPNHAVNMPKVFAAHHRFSRNLLSDSAGIRRNVVRLARICLAEKVDSSPCRRRRCPERRSRASRGQQRPCRQGWRRPADGEKVGWADGHRAQHAVCRFSPAPAGLAPNGTRLRRKVLWHNYLSCQMPPACPGDRYVHRYTCEPLRPLLPRSRRRLRRRERGRDGLYGHVCVASSVKLPRTSRGHLVFFIPSRKLSRLSGSRLNLVPLGASPAGAGSRFSAKSTSRVVGESHQRENPKLECRNPKQIQNPNTE